SYLSPLPAARARQLQEGARAHQPEARLEHAQHQDLLEPRAQEGARAQEGGVRQVQPHQRPAQAAQLGEPGLCLRSALPLTPAAARAAAGPAPGPPATPPRRPPRAPPRRPAAPPRARRADPARRPAPRRAPAAPR
ncbi:Protein of unknown function, partial [Gryllus bimaculatus]